MKEWAKHCCLGGESVKDNTDQGQPFDKQTSENIAFFEKEISNKSRVHVKESATRINRPKTTVIRIIYEEQG